MNWRNIRFTALASLAPSEPPTHEQGLENTSLSRARHGIFGLVENLTD